jgi:AraC-like DNA-binding protein
LYSPIFYICLLGMIFSLLLLGYNKGYKSANLFLAGVFFFSSLFFLTIFQFLFNTNIYVLAVFETVIPSFYFLICPFSYFYIRSILKDDSSLSKLDFLHFLPFAVAFIGTMPLLFSSWEYKLQIAENIRSNFWFNPTYRINIFIGPNQNKILKGIQILVYSTLNWYTVYKYKPQLRWSILHTRQYIIIRNWLIIFCAFLSLEAVFIIFGVFNVIVIQTKLLFLQSFNIYLSIMSFGFLMLNLSLLLIPQILYGLPFERTVWAVQPLYDDGEISPELTDDDEKSMPSFYSADYLAEIESSIKRAKDERLFLDHEFRMEHISNMSGKPLHHLAFFFSNINNSTFSEWRNNLRVQHSIQLINEGALKKHSLEGIASQCGFSSRHTFIRAFKINMGQTPTEYCKLKNLI